jgi:hypothetical protein
MRRRMCSAASLLLLLTSAASPARPDEIAKTPAFTNVPELASGFQALYVQNFREAREKFAGWEAQHPDEPFGQVAVAASYLFEELYRQGVLSSDFFLNEKRFLKGIEGKPDPARMERFQEAIRKARKLARQRLEKDAGDQEGLFALALSAGMESNADLILKKERLEALKRLKEAGAHAKELLAEQPDANDAYLALGTANYIIGSLSGGTRFLLRFGGIHGDKKLGMEQLGITVEKGRYLQAYAKILLALAARREKQDPLALKLLRELSEEYPESPLYAAEYAKVMGQPIPAQMHP